MLKFLYESSDLLSTFISSIKTPNQLLKAMSNNIQYGWLDFKGNIRTNFELDFIKEYRLILPPVMIKKKVGVCQDQTIFESYVFKHSEILKDIKTYHIFVQSYYTSSTHTFMIYKIDNKFMHFENSFYNIRGIHGPYSDIKTIVKNVHKEVLKDAKSIYHGFFYSITSPERFTKALTWEEYGDIVGWDEQKS